MTARSARMALLVPVMVLFAGTLAACQGEVPTQAGAQAEPEAVEADIFAASDDLPRFTLQPMDAYELGDFEPQGDKRCSFATNPALPPLLVATGFLRQPDAPVDVLAKYGGQIVEGTLMTPGGFDAIRQQATFDTGGMIIEVARRTGLPAGNGTAPSGNAVLRATMAGQEQQTIEGYWTCTA